MLVVTPRQCLTMVSMQLCKSSSYIARLTATLRTREGAWFQSCWDNARICPSIGVSGYKGLDWFCLTPTCPSCEQLPPEQNMSECFVQDLWLRLALGWQERTKLLAFSYLCTEKSIMGIIWASFSGAGKAGQPRLVCASNAVLLCPTCGN